MQMCEEQLYSTMKIYDFIVHLNYSDDQFSSDDDSEAEISSDKDNVINSVLNIKEVRAAFLTKL